MARVESMVKEHGWNLMIAREIAVELGVSLATVRRDWHRVRTWTQRVLRTDDIALWRSEQVNLLTDIARDARRDRDYTGAVRAIETQAKIIGTIAPTRVEATVTGTVLHVPVVTPAPEAPAALGVDDLSRIIDATFAEVEPAVVPGELAAPVAFSARREIARADGAGLPPRREPPPEGPRASLGIDIE